MNDLYIAATADTPEIEFNFSSNTFTLSGESYPENGDKFYRPVLSQLQSYLETCSGNAIQMNFKLVYFNSFTAKILYNLFGLLDSYAQANPNCVELNWYSDEEDDMILDFGLDIKEDYSSLKFNSIVTRS